MKLEYDELYKALEESVKLQSHYANLLNFHDGGSRMEFVSVLDWIVRLRFLKIKENANKPNNKTKM